MTRREIYENAAKRIADGNDLFCCFAIIRATGRVARAASETTKFREVYGLYCGETFEWLGSREGWYDYVGRGGRYFDRDVRLTALSLAYSVLTYRRPKSRSRKRRFRKIAR